MNNAFGGKIGDTKHPSNGSQPSQNKPKNLSYYRTDTVGTQHIRFRALDFPAILGTAQSKWNAKFVESKRFSADQPRYEAVIIARLESSGLLYLGCFTDWGVS